MFCDSLLILEEFEPLHNGIRRKLSAALQDEVQQALNAYLNSDSREITRRRQKSKQYSLYSQYLQRAASLLESKHFLFPILNAKALYFEGLQKRIVGQSSHNINLIQEALTLQLRALTLTKEASFIYNEIAINYSLLKNPEEAKRNFVFAIDYAPSWSIPFSNFAQQFLEEDIPKALRIARHATRLSPKNSYAYNILGIVYFQSKDFEHAENSFLKEKYTIRKRNNRV